LKFDGVAVNQQEAMVRHQVSFQDHKKKIHQNFHPWNNDIWQPFDAT